MLRKFVTPSSLAVLCALAGLGVAQAATRHHRSTPHKRINGLAAPRLLTPANNARVEQLPTLTWNGVSKAVAYEYQVSQDARFRSIVLGSGRGKGTSLTHNLAAALSKPVLDSARPYYWRVRAVSAAKRRGPWSAARRIFKLWAKSPVLLGPADGATIAWPSTPLVLSWSSVPYATEYIVTVATDPGLANVVIGTARLPQRTFATAFTLPKTLPSNTYYWAITPVDADGHLGARSAVKSFAWTRPTSTTTHVRDLNPDPRVFDPQFSWDPIPGAAKYEVEVNSAEGFPAGSKWCCSNTTTGAVLSPTVALANNEYYWRVRAIDANGNAGAWNAGAGLAPAEKPTGFIASFDGLPYSSPPTIPNLTMRDVDGTPRSPGFETKTPIITWSPVPGAASYQVQIAPFIKGSGCYWTSPFSHEKQTVDTAGLAWTPLGELSTRIGPVPAWPRPDTLPSLKPGEYCALVYARSDTDGQGNDVISKPTQLGEPNQPAFKFLPQDPPGPPLSTPLETQTGDYLPVRTGSTPAQEESCPATNPRTGQPFPCRSTPLFTWNRVPGASSYYVVLARDAQFTHVIDVASTVVPAYAPQLEGEAPLDDETTTYYWAVVPVDEEGRAFTLPPDQDTPQRFNKSSVPPTPTSPAQGATVTTQPTFSWTAAHTELEQACPLPEASFEPPLRGHCLIWDGERNYTLQVSQDETFHKLLEEVRTDSTSYASATTYPAHVTLYWRVRANSANRKTEGLRWSAVQTFERTFEAPSPAAGNPATGQAIPVLSWTPVSGATAYEVHIEQSNGTTKDYTVYSPSFVPTEPYAGGAWRWSVRALFPTNTLGTVPGPYFFPAQTFIRELAPPTGVRGSKSGSRVVISWSPEPYAKEYEVDVATTDAFTSSTSIDRRRVQGTSWAPDIDFSRKANRGTLFWRVAAVDARGNVGAFAEGRFAPPRARCKAKRGKHGAKKKCVVRKHKRKRH